MGHEGVEPAPEGESVATTITTASAVPNSADRTGTAVRPWPRSRAKRTPAVPPVPGAPRIGNKARHVEERALLMPLSGRRRAGAER